MPEIDLLRTLLTPLSVRPFCLDIGANEGGYTHTILQHRPEAEVHCFEPLKHFWKHTNDRFADWPNVHVFPFGVSNVAAHVAGLAVHEAWTLNKPGASPRGRNAASLAREGPGTFAVDFVTVDGHLDWWSGRTHGIATPPPVEFMKIDTDGYEFRVLQGATETIQRDRPLIYIELSYMVEDIGDVVTDFLDCIYHRLNYRLLKQDGTTPTAGEMYRDYPWHTSFDVAMVPAERVETLKLLN